MAHVLSLLEDIYNTLPGPKLSPEAAFEDKISVDELIPALQARVRSLITINSELESEYDAREKLFQPQENFMKTKVEKLKQTLTKDEERLAELTQRVHDAEQEEEQIKHVVYRMRALKDRREMKREVDAKLARDVEKYKNDIEKCTIKATECGEKLAKLHHRLAQEKEEIRAWNAQVKQGKARELELVERTKQLEIIVEERKCKLREIEKELDSAVEGEKIELAKMKNDRILVQKALDWDRDKYYTASEVNATMRQWISELRRGEKW
eukprot:Plantae.Rhodophyta-Hildenbrandia_rubra.ctg3272.p1 GENE.Plantae.Rhodophyta-Hildenbrandia_rubra.ctg3272~~Plantae.Rhodophyta-Hildenbrandia_rubra.ctg3272.p1  ORF type:complete len:267 (-),score=62.83 Plantae.Rhodophyta-Hildenbrandia_rubra.ctg3272:387-1187(-)